MKAEAAYKLSQNFIAKETKNFTKKEFSELWKLVSYHATLYYESENPVISDVEYDTLFKKLEELELRFATNVQISHKVWSSLKQSSFWKVDHSRSMISLDNTYNEEDLRDFDTRVKKISKSDDLSYMIEFKFDGLGIELIYEDGILTQAITRWNGVTWEDVTENVKQISNIPKKIERTWTFEVRWEVVMPLSSFERLNTEAKESGWKIFSNPRNAASGSLRVLDIEITKKRDLKYFAYDVSDTKSLTVELSEKSWGSAEYADMIGYLESLGFDISSYFIKGKDISEVIENIHNIGEIKKQIDFEIDGLVLKVNDMNLWNTIWFTEHHPRYAIAYKFPAEIVTTKLISVDHSVGRTGTITPVANLDPVTIGWAIIRRATLHNYEEIEKLWVKVWDIVFLKRAWEVIPKIISVATSVWNEWILPPKNCPSCDFEVKKDQEKVRYYCPNSYGCPAQMREKIAFAVGKQWFNIDWFWEKQAELFYTLWFINTFWDIFKLKKYKDNILSLDWFQEKSVNKLLDGIEKVRNTNIISVLKALWIPGVGKKTAKTLATLIHSERDILSNEFLNLEILESLPDIGPEVAESVILFFTNHRWIVEQLLEEVNVQFSQKVKFTDGTFTGKKVCITGSFDWYSRDELVEILEKQGWSFVGSISKNTDYLLAWDKAGSKLKKANELWVEVLSLEAFIS